MEREVFKKQLSGGLPEKIYTAASKNVRIFSMAFEGQRLYWAQDGSINSVIPSDPNPQLTYKSRPAPQARNGIGIIGATAYWTAIDEVYGLPLAIGAFPNTVKDVGTTDRRLNGLVVVKP